MTLAFTQSDFTQSAPIQPDPMQLQLNISLTIQQNAWQLSRAITTPGGRWQAYLNQMSLRVVLDWLTSDGFTAESDSVVSVWPTSECSSISWELINGSLITLGGVKIAVIPSEGLDQDGLEVPQEWVDIPERAADYFLAVRLNPEQSWLECWGFTTHQHLKSLNDFDMMDRTYRVDADLLTRDISTLLNVLEFCPQVSAQAALTPFPTFSAARLAQLTQRLASQEVSFPRLSVPFIQWAALVSTDQSWQRLCNQRLANYRSAEVSSLAIEDGRTADSAARTEERRFVVLSEWVRSLQANVQELLQRSSAGSFSSDFSVGDLSYAVSVRSNTEQTPNQTPLQQLLSQRKEIQLGQHVVLLAIQCEVDDDGLLDARFALQPTNEDPVIPEGLALALVDDEGEVLDSAQASAQETMIQLEPLKFSIGDRILLAIALANTEYTESFEA